VPGYEQRGNLNLDLVLLAWFTELGGLRLT